jgi:tetratricopeptide (TPR) repeat protein
MRTKITSFTQWMRGVAFVAVVAMSVTLAWGLYIGIRASNQSPTTSESKNEISQMTIYTKQGRYDDAVKLGLQLLKNDPGDEIVYQQIADVYFIRAKKDPIQREDWVTKAVSYVEKSLLFNSKERDVAGVHLFQDARGFELAGDLSTHKRCDYYQKARKLLEDRNSHLRGDQIALAGKTLPVQPLRNENDRILGEVKDKATRSQCR